MTLGKANLLIGSCGLTRWRLIVVSRIVAVGYSFLTRYPAYRRFLPGAPRADEPRRRPGVAVVMTEVPSPGPELRRSDTPTDTADRLRTTVTGTVTGIHSDCGRQ